MTKPNDLTRTQLGKQDRAEATTAAANAIMDAERIASDAKVARLKAMRLAAQPPAPSRPARPARAPAQQKASAIRKIQLAD